MSKAVAYKTVDAFSGITGRKLWLKEGPHPQTDGFMIEAPLRSPEVVLAVDRLLAHILFRTNQETIFQFCSIYAAKIATVCDSSSAPLPPEKVAGLRLLLIEIANVLEVRRVTSLWGCLYEGSYESILAQKKSVVSAFADDAHSSIGTYAALVEAGFDVPEGEFTPFEPALKKALDTVEGRGPKATLLAVKRLVFDLITHITEKEGLASRSTAMHQLLDSTDLQDGGLSKFYSQVKPGQLNGYANDVAQKEAKEAIQTPLGDIDKVAQDSTDEMLKAIDKAKHSEKDGAGSADDWLSKDAKAKVVLHDVSKEETELFLKVKGKTALPDSLDAEIVQRLRQIFNLVTSKRRTEVYSSGVQLDSMAFVQYKLSRTARPVFREMASGRGFKALILMDRSSSLGGELKKQVERACRILNRALKYPFVELDVWGFNGSQVGSVDIWRFEPNSPCYETEKAQVGGFTPIHIATHLGIRHLTPGTSTKHLFMLTDGVPNYHTKNGVVDRELINKITAKEIVAGRARGIGVTGAIIPKVIKNKGPDHSNKPFMNIMFGKRGDWSYLDATNIGDGLIRLVSNSFVKFLQSR